MSRWSPYVRFDAPAVSDELERQHSNYVPVPLHQPTETSCLAASFDNAALSLGASGSYLHHERTEELAALIGTGGWHVPGLLACIAARFPDLVARVRAGAPPQPSQDVAYVILVPGSAGRIGHAMAVTHECGPTEVLDPMPVRLGGGYRPLNEDEASRWHGSGCQGIELRART